MVSTCYASSDHANKRGSNRTLITEENHFSCRNMQANFFQSYPEYAVELRLRLLSLDYLKREARQKESHAHKICNAPHFSLALPGLSLVSDYMQIPRHLRLLNIAYP